MFYNTKLTEDKSAVEMRIYVVVVLDRLSSLFTSILASQRISCTPNPTDWI